MSRYADWKAPKDDNATLVWPDAPRPQDDLAANKARLDAADTRVQNVPLAHWRRDVRRLLAGDADRPLVATGHQIELYHPGVWVKNVVLDAVARQTGAMALHVAVDTDSPKHLQLRWPGGAVDVSDDLLLHTGEWSGQVSPPSPQHWNRVREKFDAAAADWAFTPSTQPVFDAIGRLSPDAPALPPVLVEACRTLDADLGLSYEVRQLSPLLELPAYLAFVHHVAADIGNFASHYNAALADYRTESGITTASRPMPDLRTDDPVELPFWLDRLDTGDRSRATVVLEDGRYHLLGESAAFAFDPGLPGHMAAERLAAFCRGQNLRLSPRALTLTTFLRLVVADQFVHGIGGGRYDQVTDRLIESYFGLPAPAFAVATATQFFPNAGERDPQCVPCLMNEGHRLRHNVVAKDGFLATIQAAPRRSAERRVAFAAMHGELQATAPQAVTLVTWRQRLEHALARRDEEAVLFDRELFYAIQPRERLTGLIERVRKQLTAIPAER